MKPVAIVINLASDRILLLFVCRDTPVIGGRFVGMIVLVPMIGAIHKS